MAAFLRYSEVIMSFHLQEAGDLRKEIAGLLASRRIKIAMLDDDPTGIQTVHDCLLLTDWEEKSLRMAFEDEVPFFYILTNSRSMCAEDAVAANREIVGQLMKVNRIYRFQLIIVSRSDSTLRGHFPMETDAIKEVLSAMNMAPEFPVFFIPAFFEAGRYTLNNIHYMKNGDELIPVGETEFARDNVFGYGSSHLADYIVEKSNHKISVNDVGSLAVAELRDKKIEEIRQIIMGFQEKEFIIVNALSYLELQKFALAVLPLAMGNGKPLVLRTSSSMPKAISGIKDKPLLVKDDFMNANRPGIFIVGSHVHKTTSQLNRLLGRKEVKGIEVDVFGLLENRGETMANTMDSVQKSWDLGYTPVVYTSRQEVRMEDKAERLGLGKKISRFLADIIKCLPARPAYILAKGGITAHDILTLGLNLEFARVAGQIIAGVPVVVTGNDHKYPSLPYIIFPGNVGDENALVTVFNVLK